MYILTNLTCHEFNNYISFQWSWGLEDSNWWLLESKLITLSIELHLQVKIELFLYHIQQDIIYIYTHTHAHYDMGSAFIYFSWNIRVVWGTTKASYHTVFLMWKLPSCIKKSFQVCFWCKACFLITK
jgi:hypothetical protein